MKRLSVVLLFLVVTAPIVLANSPTGEVYHDLAVYAFENEQYPVAESHIQTALSREPGNARYHHLSGQIYLRNGQLESAEKALETAWKTDPQLFGLAFDRALLTHLQGRHAIAAARFEALLKKDPDHVLGNYYGGISQARSNQCEKALIHLRRAAKLSPNLAPRINQFLAYCDKLDTVDMEMEIAGAQSSTRKKARRWQFFARISAGYDDNVPLNPLETDIAREEEQDDSVGEAFLWTRFHLVNTPGVKAGLGAIAYQSLHRELEEFNLTGLSPEIFTHFRGDTFEFRVSYKPSWYWFDEEDYLLRHTITPALIWNATHHLRTRLVYTYQDNDYEELNDYDGDSQALEFDTRYSLPSGRAALFGGLGYTLVTTVAEDFSYSGGEVWIGFEFKMPWKVVLRLEGRFERREYDEPDTYFADLREDDGYTVNLKITRSLGREWLDLQAEGEYRRNDSNIDAYDFERGVGRLALIFRY